jgi:3'(2'), 5'-bisphosphate nucleotidase
MAEPHRLKPELETATGAVRAAARLCLDVLREMELMPVRKRDSSPVTVADYGSQALICREIGRAFPGTTVVAEESSAELSGADRPGLSDSVLAHVRAFHPEAAPEDLARWIDLGSRGEVTSRYWTVDPVDGTKGFLRGNQFAVALALVEDGRPVLACVACPRLELGDWYGVLAWALRGEGAYVEPLFGGRAAARLRVRATADASAARYCESVEHTHSSHDDAARLAEALGISEPPIRMDSQAKYAVVAHGDAEIYLRLPSGRRFVENVWDHAAGSLLVEEAGGRVTDINGAPLDFGHGRRLTMNRGVIATNGLLHDQVLDALGSSAGKVPGG